MGANSPEVWQNLGLCCFYAAQYDMSLKCLESALAAASDDTAADIWWDIKNVVATAVSSFDVWEKALKQHGAPEDYI